MPLQSLRTLCKAPGGQGASGSAWKQWGGLSECLGGLRMASGPNYILPVQLVVWYHYPSEVSLND